MTKRQTLNDFKITIMKLRNTLCTACAHLPALKYMLDLDIPTSSFVSICPILQLALMPVPLYLNCIIYTYILFYTKYCPNRAFYRHPQKDEESLVITK